ncbi:MAG: ATP-dependent helicase [Candidatus Diapherotrites archaeon]|nr:ATP-dependent helicase [Candidatus Diapherotrites archaeon]
MVELQTQGYTDSQLFNLLNPLLGGWFKARFKSFTEPQRFAIPNIHFKENTLISAPTGTGKTLAAFSAVLSELITLSEQGNLEDKVYCVYISPLRALSNDIEKNLDEPLEEIEKVAKKIGKKLDIRVAVRTGDTPTSERQRMLRKPPHILITTPESLSILLTSPKFVENLKGVQWCIVDEIHALASSKRGVHLSLALERLQMLSPETTRVGLSATIAPLDEVAKFLVGMENEKTARKCKIVDVSFLKEFDLQVVSPLPDFIDVSQKHTNEALYETLHKMVSSHKTTLVFTNTRSATERVVHNLKDKFPKDYSSGNLEAHHSSLSREHRLNVENRLKEGRLKCVVSSTSLELGIDIGFIDLVVLLGSPKSIARALQRMGRAGHQLHARVEGRIIVLDRDDLVECAVLLKDALERKIDRIDVPQNCLDVLAQQIFGFAVAEQIHEKELFNTIRKSYCYHGLSKADFDEVVLYLAGHYASLETRHVYAKIWLDEKTGMIGRRGRLARVLYMTNVGTIPDEARVEVKLGEHKIGTIDEIFLERLNKGDVFVLGGQSYVFKFSRGMTCQVETAHQRPPTVPSWFSEMLPLSFDLGLDIQKFRRLMEEKLRAKTPKKELLAFLQRHLFIDAKSANAIHSYFREQWLYSKEIPNDKKLVVEHFTDAEGKRFVIFHSTFGRRVNDALGRAFAYLCGRLTHKDIEITLNDNGFMLSADKVPVQQIFSLLKKNSVRDILNIAVEKTEVFKRRFRHCATRSLMILRNYRGRTKSVGRQQMGSFLLLNAVRRVSENFPILKETRREIMEDLMDVKSAQIVADLINDGKITVVEIHSSGAPSPFAFNLFAEGYADIMRMEGRIEFIKRMHLKVLERIGNEN